MSKKILTILLASAALITTLSTLLTVFYTKKYKHNYCTITVRHSHRYCPEKDHTLKSLKAIRFEDDIDD